MKAERFEPVHRVASDSGGSERANPRAEVADRFDELGLLEPEGLAAAGGVSGEGVAEVNFNAMFFVAEALFEVELERDRLVLVVGVDRKIRAPASIDRLPLDVKSHGPRGE